jgi:hypothetical protein
LNTETKTVSQKDAMKATPASRFDDTPADKSKVDDLTQQIGNFTDYYHRKLIVNRRYDGGVIVGAIVIGLAGAATGYLHFSVSPVILGVLSAALVACHRAFNFGGKAQFYRGVVCEAKCLRDRLRYKIESKGEFEGVLDEFAALRRMTVKLPAGKGIDAVKSPSAPVN